MTSDDRFNQVERYQALMDSVQHRMTNRAFDPDYVVPKEHFEMILEAARHAPSGANAQPWHYIVVTEPAPRLRGPGILPCVHVHHDHVVELQPLHLLDLGHLDARREGEVLGDHPAQPREIPLGQGYAAPSVADGRVYINDYDEQQGEWMVRCLQLEDGQQVWKYAVKKKILDAI